MIWLVFFYIVDCELMNIGAMQYINGLTMNKKQVKSLVLYLFWAVTIRQKSVKNVRFSVSIDILSAQKGAKLVPQNILKMHLWPALCPGPHLGSLQRSPDPPS